jgi:ribosomal protein S12 methylthiotransferase accessory factor
MSQQMEIGFPGGRRVDARYDGFLITTDQSPESGGEGSAPEPFDLFLASLGTCAGVYVSAFCEKRGIPTDGIRLVQSWTRDEKTRRLTEIRIDIEVPPEFPEKYLTALERAADQCSVKKVLADPPALSTRAVLRASP